jgi:hypothetical protein
MRIFLLIIFLFILPTEKKKYYVKLENYDRYHKYVMVKYENNKGNWITKELKIKPKKHYGFFVYNKTFYLFSVSYFSNGNVKYNIRGKDGVGFMKQIGGGRPVWYQKMDCEMYLRGIFKTVHIGI